MNMEDNNNNNKVMKQQAKGKEVVTDVTPSSSSSCSSPPKMVVLRSQDNVEFEVEESVAFQSSMVKTIVEEDGMKGTVPLYKVPAKVLSKVIEYWKYHGCEETAADGNGNRELIKKWDAEFVKVEKYMLFDLILAANYLESKPLMDLCCQAVADTIKEFSPEEVRDYFHIDNDFSPEEEEKIRRENSWAFES